MGAIGIEVTKITPEYLEGIMPVDQRTHQPYGLLHGGASAALAETLGSLAAAVASGEDKTAVGVELSSSHLRGIRAGSVTGRAYPLRLGKSLHVWEIKIHETGNEAAGLVCHSKLTVMIRDITNPPKSQ
eukprot:CAMPEP_0170376464 /NCGR_PEP_ID=MMETSP0117_2-20130122/11739_1 /TAXON_ID=400756 /ORGANISM="Durinskia baltica, Strain CSIRO CS-38" /LENGTH=128 /DNA_ID=CAMNT_0010631669 /DNA_START=157 /DNA_END=543 /DNA_ORIENTATION=+